MSSDKEMIKFKNAFFASCPTGLEALLEEELLSFGAGAVKIVKGGVHFESFPEIAIKSILYSRIASRIYKKLFGFTIKTEKDIYFNAREIKWKAVFDLEQTFKIQVVQGKSPQGSKRSKFPNSMFLAQQLKDAIVDRFRADVKDRPNVDKDNPEVSLLMRVEPNDNPHSVKEDVTILLDMCGLALSNRGYRLKGFSAPLRENLAAGLLKIAGYTGKEVLVDGMCGSGTFITEAAIMALNLPACFIRLKDFKETQDPLPWDFLNHTFYLKDKYLIENTEKMIEEAYSEVQLAMKKAHKLPIYGYDIEAMAIDTTNYNLEAAGLTNFIHVERADITKIAKPTENGGIFIANPPYGERLGDEEQLADLYYNLGENLKHNFPGFKAYIFTGNLNLLKKISLRASKKHILYNGAIESRLAEYLLY
jgi:putative N6-adenine-specific DNA methylase